MSKHRSGGYVFNTTSDVHAVHSCNCIGPQPGQPLCPCAMQGVTIEDGRYVHRRDLGPAPGGEGTIGNPKLAALLIAAKSLEPKL